MNNDINCQPACKRVRMKKSVLMVIGVLLLGSRALAISTVYTDDFNDNNRNGWYKFNDDDSSRALVTSSGNLTLDSSAAFRIWGAVTNFSEVTIGDGEYINLSLDFQILEDIGSATISFGLFGSNGTKISADQADLTNLTDESGYYKYNRSADLIMKAGNGTGLGQVNGTDSMVKTQPSPFATADVTWHTYSLTITNNAGQITATTVFDAGLGSELIQSDAGSAVDLFTFDTLAVQSITKDFAIDNVVITTTGSVIPEPSSVALILFVSIAGIRTLRKKRGSFLTNT